MVNKTKKQGFLCILGGLKRVKRAGERNTLDFEQNPGSGSFIRLRQGYGGTSGLVHGCLKHET